MAPRLVGKAGKEVCPCPDSSSTTLSLRQDSSRSIWAAAVAIFAAAAAATCFALLCQTVGTRPVLHGGERVPAPTVKSRWRPFAAGGRRRWRCCSHSWIPGAETFAQLRDVAGGQPCLASGRELAGRRHFNDLQPTSDRPSTVGRVFDPGAVCTQFAPLHLFLVSLLFISLPSIFLEIWLELIRHTTDHKRDSNIQKTTI